MTFCLKPNYISYLHHVAKSEIMSGYGWSNWSGFQALDVSMPASAIFY